MTFVKKLSIILTIVGLSLLFFLNTEKVSAQDTCKVCSLSGGESICILADEDEAGWKNCTAGEICLIVNGVSVCFPNACQTSQQCALPPQGC